MIRSMTGFGSAEAEWQGQRLSAQIQSVNHRFCEISVRLPRSFSQFEAAVRNQLGKRFARGKVVFQLNWEGRDEPGRKLKLDRERIQQYLDDIRALGRELGVNGELDIGTVLALPDIWTQETEAPDEGEAAKILESLADRAADDLISMREREGESLADEFKRRLASITALVEQAEKKNSNRPAALKERMLTRLKPLLDGVEVDPSRLAQEVAILADRLDFTEECVRLRAHVEQYSELLESSEPVGRKLNFLLQEMNREANTMGSKANDADLASIVVDLKDELEKVREQVQNIE